MRRKTAVLVVGLLLPALPAPAQTGEALIPIVEQQNATWSAHDLEAMPITWADDIVTDYVPFGLITEGKEAGVAFNASFFESFPDITWTTQRMLAAGSIVVDEWVASGTQLGEFLGIPATGIYIPGIPHLTISEFEGALLKKSTTYLDYVGVYVALGVMPPSEPVALEPTIEMPASRATGLVPLEAAIRGMNSFNSHDMVKFTEEISEDAVIFMNTVGVPVGRNEYTALNELFLIAFPDLRGDVLRTVDLGDGWVLVEVAWSGTQDGPYFGVPASGRISQQRSAHIGHWDADGLLTELRFYYDNMTVLTNIGAVGGDATAIQSTTWGQIKLDHAD